VAPYFRGCSARTCDLNSLSRSASYSCFISSIDLPTTGPDALNTHAQTEQAHPWKRSRLTHTISRAKEHLRQERFCGGRHNGSRRIQSQARATSSHIARIEAAALADKQRKSK
jgi:hypothetical protein